VIAAPPPPPLNNPFPAHLNALQKAQADARYERRHTRWENLMRRHLRRVVADPKLLRRVPPGSLDGFIKADAAGLVPGPAAPAAGAPSATA
jgi:hypothetical protein